MSTPLIAILRGVTPVEVVEITGALIDEGFTMIEVPLNSPDALTSVKLISEIYGNRVLIGAGTVLTVEQVKAVAAVGGKLIVSPNINADVVKRSKELGLISVPGVATPTEMFNAIDAGADAVKAFPADMFPPSTIKSWCAVMPEDFHILAVGGITPDNMAAYIACGVKGFGIGSNLYKSGKSLNDLRSDAKKFIQQISNI